MFASSLLKWLLGRLQERVFCDTKAAKYFWLGLLVRLIQLSKRRSGWSGVNLVTETATVRIWSHACVCLPNNRNVWYHSLWLLNTKRSRVQILLIPFSKFHTHWQVFKESRRIFQDFLAAFYLVCRCVICITVFFLFRWRLYFCKLCLAAFSLVCRCIICITVFFLFRWRLYFCKL